ncbi:MAG: 16S rRNA (uracil(1498)-N(3))-methyltransferase [Alphaproteobacteria bacterium]|nr:16S rRNA (uracil(1498)-N(3))-methyltransferase [Alphaproteobacteria bacterium]
MSATPRLFVESDLSEGSEITLDADPAHYLGQVLRLGPDDPVRLFNGRDGEFACRILEIGRNALRAVTERRVRVQQGVPDLWLVFAPLKKTRTDFVVEKATELGVREILPVLTQRCEARAVRTHRLQRIAVEAAEQTERLDIPLVRDAADLGAVLASWPSNRPLYFCDEAGDEGEKPWGGAAGRAFPMAEIVKREGNAAGAILVGPEGGFSGQERAWLRGLPFVRPVGVGPRILRAETAALGALVVWQAVQGDWNPGGLA